MPSVASAGPKLRHSCNRCGGLVARPGLMPGSGVGFGLDRVRSDDSGAGRSYWWTTGEAMKLANGFTLIALGLLMAGCVQSTLEPASHPGLNPPDKELLENA